MSLNLNKLLKLNLVKLLDDNELEVKFGTKNIKRISKIDFDNVIRKLKSLNYKCANEQGNYSLKIQNEFLDEKSGNKRISNIRTEIEGEHNIQQYCNTDSIDKLKNVSFLNKSRIEGIEPIDVDPFNFRITYMKETKLQESSRFIKNLVYSWKDSRKIFRYMNRISFTSDKYPVRIDLSVVKSGNTQRIKGRNVPIPVYKLADSNIFNNMESYEIEIELLNSMLGPLSYFDNENTIEQSIKKVITDILSGLQETNYPISYTEQNKVLKDYIKLIHGKDLDRKIQNKDFIGPSSYTLQMMNVQEQQEDIQTPNIRNHYTVTDKADGMRKLLYINGEGSIYLITTNMEVQFTGLKATDNKIWNSIIDGEHILHDKQGQFIDLYAAFDIYFINKKNVRDLSFYPLNEEEIKANFRLPLLQELVTKLEKVDNQLTIQCKDFYIDSQSTGVSIFKGCKLILDKVGKGLFKYETDGLIFTPIKNGVAGSKAGESGPLKKTTWDFSFKWKPPEFNTIDFLISTQKDENKIEQIKNLFQGGLDTSAVNQILQYKILTLRCGYNENMHGYMNPCGMIRNEDYPKGDVDEYNNYKPAAFYPSDPSDPEAHICNIILKVDEAGNNQMMTEGGEVFGDNTIVEFKYNKDEKGGFRWKPIKVRYDKTLAYRQGLKEYGNAYHVANSNWFSIHNPITETMLKSGENIPIVDTDESVYYNRTRNTEDTRNLRNFHNLIVKKMLITSVAEKGDTLIDLAVGKGGDMSKWIDAKLSFVFGIDVSKDNIENRVDGACARYLNMRKKYKTLPSMLFVEGNSGLNIRDGDGIEGEQNKLITKAIFGEGPKDETNLGKGVLRNYGKGANGFKITSCQFALHYFFENKVKLHNFLTNIVQVTQLGGYFIGTCYDGKKIFNLLKNKKKGESEIIMRNGGKIWEITKNYNEEEFTSDELSIGIPIDVYQESINKSFKEYLVSFEYLTRILENYGFVLLSESELEEKKLPSSLGSFGELYQKVKAEERKNIFNLSPEEERISVLNNYFIFKKARNVDVRKIVLDNDINVEEIKPVEPKKRGRKKKNVEDEVQSNEIEPKKRGRKKKSEL